MTCLLWEIGKLLISSFPFCVLKILISSLQHGHVDDVLSQLISPSLQKWWSDLHFTWAISQIFYWEFWPFIMLRLFILCSTWHMVQKIFLQMCCFSHFSFPVYIPHWSHLNLRYSSGTSFKWPILLNLALSPFGFYGHLCFSTLLDWHVRPQQLHL